MNLPEALCGVLALAAILGFLFASARNLRWSLLGVLASVPAVFLSLEMMSQFLSVDEILIMDDTLAQRLVTWRLGGFKVSHVLTQPLAGLLRFLPQSLLESAVKAAHWLAGFLILIWGYALLSESFAGVKQRIIFFILCMYVLLLSPATVLALKIFNYDLLSLAWGSLAVIYLLLALSQNNVKKSLAAVICATLAAQEKFIASPALVAALLVHPYLVARNYKDGARVFRGILSGVLQGLAAYTLVGLALVFLAAGAQGWRFGRFKPAAVFDPLILLLSPFLKKHVGWWPHILYLLPLLIFFLGAGAYCALKIGSSKKLTGYLPPLERYLHNGNTIFLLGAITVGMIGTYTVHLYWGPFFLPDPGNYVPSYWINATFWHFNAKTLAGHLASYITYGYAIFISSIPTVVLAGCVAFRISSRGRARLDVKREVMLCAILLIPALHGLTQTPVSMRYFNLWLYLFLMATLLDLTANVDLTKYRWLVTLFIVMLVLELIPFRPLLAPFRPVWHRTGAADEIPRPGVLASARWWGWGEEQMLAAKVLEKTVLPHENSPRIALYCNYPGKYLGPPGSKIDVYSFYPGVVERMGGPPPRYTEHEYFLLNRLGCVQQVPPSFPEKVKPVFTIGFRGYTQAWVFRGDQLRGAGYKID
jgi:hypothetical protein